MAGNRFVVFDPLVTEAIPHGCCLTHTQAGKESEIYLWYPIIKLFGHSSLPGGACYPALGDSH